MRQEHSAKKGQLMLYGTLLAVVVGCMVALSLCDKPKENPLTMRSGGDTLDIAIEYSPVTYYTYNDKSYGLKLKDKNSDHWLNEYITFDEEQDYYIALGLASKNLGKVLDERNAPYDNALTILKYFLHE